MTARILVVDDIPANVKLLEARLTAEYFDVSTAHSGIEALAICERAQCDIVLLDVMMPEMDGFETCRRLKASPLTHHIPVVMVTALDQPSDRVRGLEAGADDFLTKPVSDIALLARVRSLVRLKMAADELRMRAVTSREIERLYSIARADGLVAVRLQQVVEELHVELIVLHDQDGLGHSAPPATQAPLAYGQRTRPQARMGRILVKP